MSVTNMNVNARLSEARELPGAIDERGWLDGDDDRTWVNAPRLTLGSVFVHLAAGRVSEVVAQFADRFRFNDHALALEFTTKARLTEFLERSRQLFPDTALEVVSILESGDHAFARWRLTATNSVPSGSMRYRFPIDLPGATIVRVENGRIVEWADYYDQASSARVNVKIIAAWEPGVDDDGQSHL
jgi:ketosteroid isomerase-like protein